MGEVLVGVESGAEDGFFGRGYFDGLIGVYFFGFLVPEEFFGVEFFLFDGADDDVVAYFGELLGVVVDAVVGGEGGVECVFLVELDFEPVGKLGVGVFGALDALERGCVELGFDDCTVAVGDFYVLADLGVVFA